MAMKENIPLVSIGIPTYNRLNGLKDALNCIRKQTYSNLEIIVSDNCSLDDEVDQYMQLVTKEDLRIRYFRQSHNIGALANFEFLLNEATGKYFAWAADDDLCDKSFVEKIIMQMERDTDIVLCSCDVRSIDENNCLIGIDSLETIRPTANWKQARKLFFCYPTSNIFFCIYGIYKAQILRKCDLKLLSGWKGYGLNGEVPWLAQVSSFGKIVALPEVLKTYRRHSVSLYHEEIKRLGIIDTFMIKMIIRTRLCTLALFDKSDFSTRIYLLSSIVNSFLCDIVNLKGIVSHCFPKKVKQFIKQKLNM